MPAGFSGVSDPWTPSQCWIPFAHGSVITIVGLPSLPLHA